MTFWRLLRLYRQFQGLDQQLRRNIFRSHLFNTFTRNVQQRLLAPWIHFIKYSHYP